MVIDSRENKGRAELVVRFWSGNKKGYSLRNTLPRVKITWSVRQVMYGDPYGLTIQVTLCSSWMVS